MELDAVDAILKLIDAFMTLAVLGLLVGMFMKGLILPKNVVEAERRRHINTDDRVESLYQQIIEQQGLRIASLEAQIQEKNQQVATSLVLMQSFQGTQDQAARAAKALLGGTLNNE